MPADEYDVFISYAAKDAGEDVLHAAEFVKWLEAEGYNVFWDLHLQVGDAQKQLIDKAACAKCVIALWSPRADKSRNVYLECAPAAIKDKLLPIIIEGNEGGLPAEWRKLVWLKLTDFEAQKPEILGKLSTIRNKTLTLRLTSEHRSTIDTNFALFSLSDLGQHTMGAEAMRVFLQLDMSPAYEQNGYAYGFQKVYIRVNFAANGRSEVIRRLGFPNSAKISNATLTARGTGFHPVWQVEVSHGILDGEYSTKEDALFYIEDIVEDKAFFAELTAQLHDGTLRLLDNRPLPSKVKQRIIARLMATKIDASHDANGYLRLATQKLRVQRQL